MIKRKNLFVVLLSLISVFCVSLGVTFNAQATTDPQSEIPAITLESGAYVRYKKNADDVSGIRFIATVTKEALNNGSAGVLVMREADLAKDELPTVGNENAMDIKALTFIDSKETDTTKTFSAVVYDIPQTDYATVLVARAYVMNGETLVYVTDDLVLRRSIGQVASGILAKGDYSSDQLETLNAYTDGALESLTVDETPVELVIGGTANVTSSVSPSTLSIAWASEDEKVATVENGVITAVSVGTTTVTATVGSTVKQITVTVDVPEAAKTELIGAYVSSMPNLDGLTVGYTTDSEKLVDGASIGINVKANYASGDRQDIVLKTSKTLVKDRIYNFDFTSIINNKGNDFNGYYINIGNNQSSSLSSAEASKYYSKNSVFMSDYTFTATKDGELEIILAMSPANGGYGGFEYTICNLSVTDVTDEAIAEIGTVASNILVKRVNYEGAVVAKSAVSIKSGTGMANSSAVNIVTNYSLEANKTYVVSYRFDAISVVGVGTNKPFWQFNFYTNADNYATVTNYKVATGISEANNTSGVTSWANNCAEIQLKVTPTAVIDNLILRVLIHGANLESFDLIVSDVACIEESRILNDFSLAGRRSGAYGDAMWVNKNSAIVYEDITDLGIEDYTVALTAEYKGPTYNATALFDLNTTLKANTTYTVTYYVIYFAPTSNNLWYFYAGIPTSSSDVTTALGKHNENGKLTKMTGYANCPYEVYKVQYEHTVGDTVYASRFQILLNQGITQKVGITGLSVVEKTQA